MPAGTSSSTSPTATRYWRTSSTRSSSSMARIATAPGMADDVARPARAVGPLDGVDPERQVAARDGGPATRRRARRDRPRRDPPGPMCASSGGRSFRRGHCDIRRERQAGLAVEQVQLVERQDEVDDVARSNAVLRLDDRDDVLVGRVDVQQLLVAEVLDDVGPCPERPDTRSALADVEVLGPEAGDERLAGLRRRRLAVARRERDRPVGRSRPAGRSRRSRPCGPRRSSSTGCR